jgi:lysozyme
MKTNQAGINLIKQMEGCRLQAYVCPAGKLTIGYGHTLGVYQGMRITEHIADELLRQDLAEFENQLNSLHLPITENQFAALISFIYNLGFGRFLSSTLKAKVSNDPMDPSIRHEFLKWTKAGGKELQGLLIRRNLEANLYFTP